MPVASDNLDEQTIQQYSKALALGQKARETPGRQAKPMPHIFGSAEYIQDPDAGLGLLQPQQEFSVSAGMEDGLRNILRTTTDTTVASPPRPFHEDTTASSIHETSEMAHQPQSFKAMLEAALKGDFAAASGPKAHSEAADVSQYQSSVHQGSHYGRAERDHENVSQSHNRQQSGDGAGTAELPHVLAWLEKGRSLFNEDE